jgi:hypothetical protein
MKFNVSSLKPVRFNNPLIITRESTQTLTGRALTALREVGIKRQKTAGVKVRITGHNPNLGTSFEFPGEYREYHVPARIVPIVFARQ